ncbi:MAG: hypothetical protein A3I61_10330 [Acidobacteria bacterium RIFCSPLOWO2_02_FULL_68_18]|nr:MAG: hypothetical protein A3I61_10330 [Acidobacteria bacterium RIFCSPLOWO2_02_FULL_68_18]OFW48648.1 MAG: hypothetical protein A3G77_14165 [Acidobacteria bacterium RIFCSPLOWO2_12_FULL_68_19]
MRKIHRGRLLGAIIALAPVTAAAQVEVEAGQVRAEIHVIASLDWRDVQGHPESSRVDLRRARIGITGALFARVEYEVEHDFREADRPWRDAFVNAPFGRAIEARVGRFKIPFSLDQLTPAAELDFVARSLGAQYLAPGRDIGAMAHGRLFARRVRFQTGVFRAGGDNVRPAERRDPRHGAVVAGRLLYRPWSERVEAGPLRALAIGAALTAGGVPEGYYSVRGHTAADAPLFPEVAVQGLRRRYGAEIDWRAGPLALGGEIMRVVDERRGQSTDDERLPDIVARGWYVRGTWLATGERKTDRVRPARSVLRGGIGAIELAARLEDLALSSRGAGGVPTRSARGDTLVAVGDRAATLGVNWYLSRFLKVQAHTTRDWRREDGAAVDARRAWNQRLRVQFAL